jgi:hypothetical protein
MGDFLTDIAERSFAAEHAIRPRPMSVYETLHAGGVVPSGQNLEAEGENTPLVPEGNARATTSTGERTVSERGIDSFSAFTDDSEWARGANDPRLLAAKTAGSPDRRRHFDTGGAPTPPTVTLSPIADRHPAATVTAEQTGEANSTRSAVEPIPAVETLFNAESSKRAQNCSSLEIEIVSMDESREVHHKESPSRQHVSGEQSDRLDKETASTNLGTKASREMAEISFLNPVIKGTETERLITPLLTQQPVIPMDSRYGNARDKQDDQREKAAQTPTIHVTIGRIEVRATQVPVQKETRPKARGAMSLDEYLNRRNGERR